MALTPWSGVFMAGHHRAADCGGWHRSPVALDRLFRALSMFFTSAFIGVFALSAGGGAEDLPCSDGDDRNLWLRHQAWKLTGGSAWMSAADWSVWRRR